jgi:hypothetical protein
MHHGLWWDELWPVKGDYTGNTEGHGSGIWGSLGLSHDSRPLTDYIIPIVSGLGGFSYLTSGIWHGGAFDKQFGFPQDTNSTVSIIRHGYIRSMKGRGGSQWLEGRGHGGKEVRGSGIFPSHDRK